MINAPRTRADLCPGALRPWSADDGLLVRLRLIGGRLPTAALARLLAVSAEFGDGKVYLTTRANLQVRSLPGTAGRLTSAALAALESTGLLPTRSHELVRNILVSPQTGHGGGRADLRGIAARLDTLLCAAPRLAALPGRFLFVLDDGRGDLIDRQADAGLVALDDTLAQLRVGDGWGPTVPLAGAAATLTGIATDFQATRGDGPEAPWHVRELDTPLRRPAAADPRLPPPSGPLPYGRVPGGMHREVPDGIITPEFGHTLPDTGEVVVTPWRGIFIPDTQESAS